MIDLETGRFILGEGLEVWPGMKLEDFKKTDLYNVYTSEDDKSDKNESMYRLKPQKIDGFELDISLMFQIDDYLTYIVIEKKGWFVHEMETEEKIGPSNNFEYENSVLTYLNEFLSSQMEGQIEGGRELTYSYKWGNITTTFLPYSVTASPAKIEIMITYRTRLFKPYRKVKTLEELRGL